jgi:O-antigen/teichoic acid export membrane protein
MGLVKNTSFYTIGAVLPKIGAFVFLPIYLKYLTPSDYGIVSSLHVLNTIFIVLFTLSMPRALYRVYYDYKCTEEKKTLFGTVLISVFTIAILSMFLLFLLKKHVQEIYESIAFYPYFAIAIVTVFIQALHIIPNIIFQIKERADLFVIINVLLFFFKSMICLWFIVGLDRGALGYLEAELIASIVFLPIYYSFMYDEINLSWDKNIFKNVLNFSLPIIPGILSAWILNLSDRIFIERFFSTTEVGIYSLGYQISGLVLIFSVAFKKAYDPYFYKIANSRSLHFAKRQLYNTNFIFVIVLLFATFVISFFAKEGIELFLDKKYYLSIQIIPIISLAYLFSQNSALLNTMMYQEKKTHFVMYITIISAILNILLNYLLIPRIGIMGAAYATLLSFLMVFISSYLLAKKTYFIPYNSKGILTVLAILGPIYYIFKIIPFSNLYISLIAKIVIVFIIIVTFFRKFKADILIMFKQTK